MMLVCTCPIQPSALHETQTKLTTLLGRAIAQAVSRWLPTAAARVRSRVWSSEICGEQSGAGAGFLRVLRFPLPVFISPIAGAGTIGQKWPQYKGLSPTPLAIKKKYNVATRQATVEPEHDIMYLITILKFYYNIS
jgi:hypothetical protein